LEKKKFQKKSFGFFFSSDFFFFHLVPAAAAFEPLNIRKSVSCSTNKLLPLAKLASS
jgi:hypothetical protein